MITTAVRAVNSFFNFSYRSSYFSKSKDKNISPLVIFYPHKPSENSFTELMSFLKEYPQVNDIQNGVINYLIIILPETTESDMFINDFSTNEEIYQRRAAYFSEEAQPLFILYNQIGEWKVTEEETKYHLDCIRNEVKISGCYNIFEEGHGILDASQNHHYILQNDFHSDKFIRTANILTQSTYIEFIALFLLDFLNEDDRNVYVDTSGISSVIYAVAKLKNIFSDYVNPNIVSFNSYIGLNNIVLDDTSKFIISASTSGNLNNELIKRGVNSNAVVILFYLNKELSNVNVLCNLSEFTVFDNQKYKHFKIEKRTDCQFCKTLSYPIRIIGEQFLPEELKVDVFMFDLRDRPQWMVKFINVHFQKNNEEVIKCYYKDNSNDIIRDIYIDFERVLKKHNTLKLERFLSTKLPHKIDVIIYYKDSGSMYLRDRVYEEYDKSTKILVIEESDIITNMTELIGKNILVVSSTITNGRRLVETSLKLRNCRGKGICYFIGMSRTPDEATIETTRKYIGYDNKHGKDVNPLRIAESIYLSDSLKNYTFSETPISSWEAEKQLLCTIDENFFQDRITSLNNTIGLSNNLYWGDDKNKLLQLRANFAFFSGTTCEAENTTQAQLFFIINTVLHNVRQDKGRKIFQSAFHRYVISPEMFICFNDGIIQASILRSANPVELNYNLQGHNAKIGTEMINVINYIFSNFSNKTGEATIEFLIAIASNRLQLIAKQLEKSIVLLLKEVEVSDVVNKEVIIKLSKFILNKLSNGRK